MRPDPVEVIARELAKLAGVPEKNWPGFADDARLIHARLKDAGYAVVPVEPTEAMQNAMLEAVKDGIAVNDDAHRSVRHGYRAMLRASQEG